MLSTSLALLAITSVKCTVEAITTVAGNTSLPNVNRNVATLLRDSGLDHIPVFHGARKPLVYTQGPHAEFHGYQSDNFLCMCAMCYGV
jgi:inosine-uridine nucleoside N-ribohydrolase